MPHTQGSNPGYRICALHKVLVGPFFKAKSGGTSFPLDGSSFRSYMFRFYFVIMYLDLPVLLFFNMFFSLYEYMILLFFFWIIDLQNWYSFRLVGPLKLFRKL